MPTIHPIIGLWNGAFRANGHFVWKVNGHLVGNKWLPSPSDPYWTSLGVRRTPTGPVLGVRRAPTGPLWGPSDPHWSSLGVRRTPTGPVLGVRRTPTGPVLEGKWSPRVEGNKNGHLMWKANGAQGCSPGLQASRLGHIKKKCLFHA